MKAAISIGMFVGFILGVVLGTLIDHNGLFLWRYLGALGALIGIFVGYKLGKEYF